MIIENQTPDQKPSMRWLLKLSRIAFICNICFLAAFSIQISNWIRNQDIESTIAVIGYAMGFTLNPIVNIFYLFTAIIARKRLKAIPSWLIVANVLFLIIDGFYILYLNPHA